MKEVTITREEFKEIAAVECTKFVSEIMEGAELTEKLEMTLVFAGYARFLEKGIFDEKSKSDNENKKDEPQKTNKPKVEVTIGKIVPLSSECLSAVIYEKMSNALENEPDNEKKKDELILKTIEEILNVLSGDKNE